MAKQSTTSQDPSERTGETSECELALIMDCLELNSPPQVYLAPLDDPSFDLLLDDGFELEPSTQRSRSKSFALVRKSRLIRKAGKRKTSINVC